VEWREEKRRLGLTIAHREFDFQCNTQLTGTPTLVHSDGACSAVFEWAGIVGCPVCTTEDYSTLVWRV
jgi:hypothetical protein